MKREKVSATATPNIQVISRAADILRALKQDNTGLSLGQIAQRVDLPRSTVQRIVNALISERLVFSASRNGSLRLGPEIQSLAAAGKIDVAELVRPILKELSAETGETVDLAVLREGHMVFIDQIAGSHRLTAVSAVGETFPLSTTANGKAVLAELEDELVVQLFAEEARRNSQDARTLVQFLGEIETVREQGFALDQDEHTTGISAVGIAFEDSSGSLFALSIPVPTSRFNMNKESLISDLLQAKRKVTNPG